MELERRKTRNFLKEMKQLIFVFIGGGLGSILRYLTVKYLNNYSATIPFGTFIANILGSLGIGIVLGMAIKNNSLNHHQTLFLASGFCFNTSLESTSRSFSTRRFVLQQRLVLQDRRTGHGKGLSS